MRKLILLAMVAMIATMGAVSTAAAKPSACATIAGGTIVDSANNPVQLGYDQYGYNYQAHLFNGYYGNYSRPAVPVTSGDSLIMKWNDAWMSNKDCNNDTKLDRHYGHASYIGSGAWLTNHGSGSYVDVDGNAQHWTYFVKIVAAPSSAVLTAGVWYSASGTEIGPAIWGAFAIVQEIYNDTGTGDHGVLYKSPSGPGFGHFD